MLARFNKDFLISISLVLFSGLTAGILIYRVVNPAAGATGTKGLSSGASDKIVATGASYKSVSSEPSGWFTTGQNADLALSAIDFNNAGGPLLFNHQGGIATDGQHLLLADRNNNRVLIWNSLPSGNSKPDVVLGQPDFTSNNPGDGLDNLNWPVSVATDGTHIFVTDTYNNRILVWNSFPTKNDTPADFQMVGSGPVNLSNKLRIIWPWAVWTNGKKLIVANTGASSVLIWNSMPTKDTAPDVVLTAGGDFGTPRSIASDGANLMIGDHNAKPNSNNPGNFFWKTFPTSDSKYDFFLAAGSQQNDQIGDIFWGGVFASDGRFMTIGQSIYIWNKFPVTSNRPDLAIGAQGPGANGFNFDAGDGSGIALAGNRLYVSTSNGNRVVVFNSLPSAQTTQPDFAIGAPDLSTNTLETNFIMSNPVPATDGKSLFVSSDFDRKLYVYKNLPDQSNAHPDYVYPYGGWDNALYGSTFAEADTGSVYIWKSLPTNGQKPDETLSGGVGNITFHAVKGVAMDSKYFYLSDTTLGKVYVFDGVPTATSNPKFTLSVNDPIRLDSDGNYLLVMTTEDNVNGHAELFKVSDLKDNAKPIWTLKENQVSTNLPQGGTVADGHLFIDDTSNNRVLAWTKIADAIAGAKPDVILGKSSLDDLEPRIGRNQTFWPSNSAFDGSFLWLGEFKFSERLLRYSVH